MDELLGTRYKLFGYKPEWGFDCVNFCAYVYNTYKNYNVKLPIKYRPKTGFFEKELDYLLERLSEFDVKEISGPKDMCLVIMPGDGRNTNHIGIYNNGFVYHMSFDNGLTKHRLDFLLNSKDFIYYE